MPQEVVIHVLPEILYESEQILYLIAQKLKVSVNSIQQVQLRKRSVDARKPPVRYELRYQVWMQGELREEENTASQWQDVSNARPVHIIGLGPAGLFAALRLIELGYKPIVIERGKAVRERRRDLAALNKEGIVNPDSNYCFGEGGAGTFSDGKLYTRSTKRGDTQRVLQRLCEFGASPDILIDAHPHIGTNKLPQIIQSMREKITECGGEVRFNTRLTGLRHSLGKISSLQYNNQEWEEVEAVILATGHSARDIFQLLDKEKINIEAKPFALGVRVEHPQSIIDSIQYHCKTARHENLPAASYSLVRQVQGKGVYSFCMCPGGIICPAATENNQVVVNGWSPSKRDSPFANSGMVVEIAVEDYLQTQASPLDGILFQEAIEKQAYQVGGGKQVAPAQRLADFVKGKASQNLPDCSYLPGIHAADMRDVLPKWIAERLRGGFKAFGENLKGFLTNEAVIVGVESRTSSPIRIPRDAETLMHPEVQGLFPCAEGAGYAGGIMSAAIDGQKCAEAAIRFLSY